MPTGYKIRQTGSNSWVAQGGLSNTGWGTNTVQDGIYANGKYTVVGTGGRIADSVDGINWTDRPQLRLNTPWGTGTIYTISWNGSVYFISGDSAYTATSTDGITWIFSSLMSSAWTTGNPAVDSLWTGSNFIVVGASNKFAISNNGVSFSSYYNGPGTPGLFEKRINWNGSQYLMTAGTTGLAYTSPDATTWTSRDVTGSNSAWLSENVIKVRYVNGIFVAGGTNGRVATSTDGLTWTYRPGIGSASLGNTINEIIWDGSKYILLENGSDYIGSTTDFITYTSTWNPAFAAAFGGFYTTVLISNSGKYVVSSNFGRTSYSGDNGVTWSAFASVSANAGAFGASLYLLVRDSGAYSTSPDGTTWTARTGLSSGTWGTKGIRDIVWNGSIFIVVGDSGGVATSSDGLTWTYQAGLSSTAWSTTSVRCVAWTGSQFIVGGDSGKIATSSDGVTWTYRGGLISTGWGTTTVSSIAWSGTRYVVGGTAGAIAHSSDAATWTFLGSSFNQKDSYYGLNTINTIIWNPTSNTYLVAGPSGKVATGNTAGIIWTYQGGLSNTAWGTTNVLDGLWDGSKYILVGASGKVATSADGVTWTNQTGLSSTTYSTNASNKVLANGTNQYIVAGTSFNTANSSNAVTWTYQSGLEQTGFGTLGIYSAATDGNKFVVGGERGKIATSTDGINWTYQNGLSTTAWGWTTQASYTTVFDIAWSGTQFLAVGPYGKVATSPDAITWTYQPGLVSAGYNAGYWLYACAWGANKFVVTGENGHMGYSADGINWTYIDVGSIRPGGSWSATRAYALVWNGLKFVMGGGSGLIATSDNGITWTDRPQLSTTTWGTSTSAYCYDIAWNGSIFLAVGSGGRVATSTDGITWAYQGGLASTTWGSNDIRAVKWDGSVFVAVGNGRAATSPDGITWTYQSTQPINAQALVVTDEKYVTAGLSGSIALGSNGFYKVDVDDVLVRREYFSDGSLWYWNNTTMSPVTAAGSGLTWKFITSGRGIFGVKSDGTLWTWGNNQASTPTQVSFAGYTNNDWKSFACGYQGSGSRESYIGIKNDGNIWAWGGNAVGQLGVGDSVNKSSPVTAVGGGGWKQVVMGTRTDNIGSTMGIKTDGTLWYMNVSPVQVAGGGTWKQVATNESSIAIKTDGTMWTWSGTSSPTTWAAAGSKTWKYIHASYRTAHAVSTDGSLWSWGNNTNGILGDGTTTNRTSFVSVAGGGTNWKSVFACGYWSTVVGLKTDGTLWSWGPIPGDGTAVAKSSPVLVAGGITNWRSVPIGSTGGPFNAAPIMMIQDLTI